MFSGNQSKLICEAKGFLNLFKGSLFQVFKSGVNSKNLKIKSKKTFSLGEIRIDSPSHGKKMLD
jgi:hypothetical protein